MPTDGLTPRRRLAVLLVWALALAAAAAVIARTPFTADLSAFLPDKPDAGQQLLIEQLQSGVAARTLLVGIDGGTAAQRADVSRRLAVALRASGRFEQVENGASLAPSTGIAAGTAASSASAAPANGLASIGTWVFEHRYQLSPAVTPERFTASGLRDAIGELLSLLGTPAGNAIKPLLEVDPTGESARIAEALIPARAPRVEDGVWVSREQPRAVLLANVAAPGADLDAQAAALALARQAFADATRAAAAPDLRLQLSGAPVFSVDSRASIESEVRSLAIAGTTMVSVLLLLAFGSVVAVGAAMLPVATGVAAGIAAVGLGFGSVHGVTLGFGATLMGEAVDYGIYYLIQAHRPAAPGEGRGQRQRGWSLWLRDSWPTVRLGLATSVCGFAALAFSGFPGLAQLGVFSCAGLIAAAAATRFVLPVLL
ncbi:MAG: MMPL family transporter, partial [Rubrivivax sp.]